MRHRLGRRGCALLAFAFIDYVIGWSFLDREGGAQVQTLASYRPLLAALPVTAWAWIWLSVAALCTVQALARRHDEAAYTAAIAIKVVWSFGMFLGWIVYDAPRGWLSAALWGVLAALVATIAGWPEPRDRSD
jgi:hypothetical protein